MIKPLSVVRTVATVLAVILLVMPARIGSDRSSKHSFNQPVYEISAYDRLFQRVATETGLDWRLLSAIAYKESQYNPTLHSRRGAVGLMQVMPLTAKHFNVPVELLEDPTLNVMVAAKLLREMEDSFNFHGVADDERVKIILAGYNSGMGNLRAARKLASQRGANCNKWDDLKNFGRLNNKETRSFVDSVFKKWKEYSIATSGD